MRMVKALVWLTIATALAMAGGCDSSQNAPRKALPSTATDIHEYNWNARIALFPGDSVYFFKAKITPEEFEVYRIKLKFVPIPETMKEEALWMNYNIAKEGDIEWWDPLPTTEATFHDPTTTGSQRHVIKYEKGYVYYWDSVGF